MASLHSYLNFNGNTEEVFEFYRSVFGGEFVSKSRFKDIPSNEPQQASDDGEKILHIALPVGQNSLLMGSDVPSSFPAATMGTNYCISINAGSEAEAEKLFNGLSAGGNILMPLDKAFWGAYFGMLADKYGVQWMVSYEYPQH